RGGASVSDPSASGGLETMTSRDMDLVYGDDGQALQRALLMGEATVVLRGTAPGGASRRLSAATIDISLAPDGATVVGLDARDRVRLDLPAGADTPARVITAAALAAGGTPEAGLTSASFRHQVVFLETPPRGAAPRRATSERLDLALEDGFDTIRSADFSGGTRFEEERLRAAAADAKYDVGAGLLQLRPAARAAGRPQVVDDQATIEADRIDVRIDGGGIDAAGVVKSNLRPGSRTPETQAAAAAGDREGGRLPSMMKQDEPVFGTSDALAYEEGGGRLVYTGRSQLWQGDTSIKGDRIELDDRNGDLSASGQVISTMSLEQVDDRTKKPEKVRSVATADDLVYEEARRRALYSGNARLNGPQGDLAADRIEIYLREGGSQVERLEAYPAPGGGTVSIKTPDGRQATGSRLTYLAADERYEMAGAPVRIVEECRETTGKTLTFFRSADRIVVDGNEQTRTEVKGSGGCSGPRLD
ncbi:MAG TPA: LptA/OstA family protein, partial [Vicinamibacterales bacterium]|nr:LptA/OstA family protein [Vicinamibacterales bacterium]